LLLMAFKVANNAASTLAAAITNVATSLSVAAGAGALFPALSGSDYFMLTLTDTSGNIEIVKVTARATDAMTIVRAQEGTAARAYALGDSAENRMTAGLLGDFAQKGSDNTFTGNNTFSGNLGVGTAPSVKFHVSGGKIYFQPYAAGADQGFQLDTAALPNGSNGIYVSAPSGWTGNIIKSNLNGVEKFRIDQDGTLWVGKAGVGAVPTAKFEVKQSADTTAGGIRVVRTGASNYAEFYVGGDNSAYLVAGNAGYICLTAAGQVGVGTASPGAMLEAVTNGSSGAAGRGLRLTNAAGGGNSWDLSCGIYAVDNGKFSITNAGNRRFEIAPSDGYTTIWGTIAQPTSAQTTVGLDRSGQTKITVTNGAGVIAVPTGTYAALVIIAENTVSGGIAAYLCSMWGSCMLASANGLFENSTMSPSAGHCSVVYDVAGNIGVYNNIGGTAGFMVAAIRLA
jgi:hypothetical protein